MSNVTFNVELEDEQLDDEALQEATRQVCNEVAAIAGVEAAELIPVTTVDPNAKGIGGFLVNAFKVVASSEIATSLLGTLAELNAGRRVKLELERTVGGNTKKINVTVGSPKDLERVVPQIQQLLDN
ncbi:MAG: hypothetical protein AAGG51_17530 [Cyanobacteria bacterium P01_G01_bin.54]